MTAKNAYFAERLRTLRERQGIPSAYALAKITGLTKQAVSLLELGRSDPSWSTVQLLALALDVDTSEFIDPDLDLPEVEEARPRGRPRKEETETEQAPKKKTARKRAKKGVK
jgi:transcriptional regulator with XRE-family HTH domain